MRAAYHLNAPGPYYTNSFLLISDAGSAVIIDGWIYLLGNEFIAKEL